MYLNIYFVVVEGSNHPCSLLSLEILGYAISLLQHTCIHICSPVL